MGMKSHTRAIIGVVLAAMLLISFAGTAAADPRVGHSSNCNAESGGGSEFYVDDSGVNDFEEDDVTGEATLWVEFTVRAVEQNNFNDPCDGDDEVGDDDEEGQHYDYWEAHVEAGDQSAQYCLTEENKASPMGDDHVNQPSEHDNDGANCEYRNEDGV